jgi:hypothetical protein
MNGVRMVALLALLNTGLSRAGGSLETNNMPEQFHALMQTEGYGLVQTNLDLPAPDAASLRNLPAIEKNRFILLKPASKTGGWSFWDNTSVKYVGRSTDPINILTSTTQTPLAALSKFEYDINCSFNF